MLKLMMFPCYMTLKLSGICPKPYAGYIRFLHLPFTDKWMLRVYIERIYFPRHKPTFLGLATIELMNVPKMEKLAKEVIDDRPLTEREMQHAQVMAERLRALGYKI